MQFFSLVVGTIDTRYTYTCRFLDFFKKKSKNCPGGFVSLAGEISYGQNMSCMQIIDTCTW